MESRKLRAEVEAKRRLERNQIENTMGAMNLLVEKMKRLAVYAHYDEAGEIKPYVLTVLVALARECESVVFVSTASLSRGELSKLDGLVTNVQLKENVGLDFGMWQSALAGLPLAELDELLLVNSSVVGPVFPLADILQKMADAPLDFWGMTENHVIKWHLQSYFLCFKKRVIASGHVQRFFASVLPYRDKQALILSYELGLTAYLSDYGFRGGSFATIAGVPSGAASFAKKAKDPTLFHPDRLLRCGLPFVKVSLFRDNPGHVALEKVTALMEAADFDTKLVPFYEQDSRSQRGFGSRFFR